MTYNFFCFQKICNYNSNVFYLKKVCEPIRREIILKKSSVLKKRVTINNKGLNHDTVYLLYFFSQRLKNSRHDERLKNTF